MDLDAMITLLGDAICNIEEEEEYWEACQHALKSPYEARTSDEDEEGGEAPSTTRVIVVVIAAVATVIVKATIKKTMIANIVAMIGVNPLVIEKMKMWDRSTKTF